MIPSCIFPSQLISQNPLSTAYSNALSLFGTGWLPTNLKLNPDKIEFLLIGHECQRIKYLSTFPITLLGNETHPLKTAKYLDIVINENFNFRTFAKFLTPHIRDLRRIRNHLKMDQAECLVSVLASSRLDCCDSLLHGVAVRGMLKLQRVQNCFARKVTGAVRFAPSTPFPHSLHWLLISFRIKFEVRTLTCKTLCSVKPSYLACYILSIWPHPAGAYGPTKAFSCLPLTASNIETGTRVFRVCALSL